MNLKHVFDLSHTLLPGREEYRLEIDTRQVDKWAQFSKYPRIDDSWYIVSEVTLNTHTGTHIEFPYHHVKDGQDAATFPLEHLFGPGMVGQRVGMGRRTGDLLGRAETGSWGPDSTRRHPVLLHRLRPLLSHRAPTPPAMVFNGFHRVADPRGQDQDHGQEP